MTADIVGNLIAGGDLDDLLRHADRLCTESDWDGLVELRDRCRQAHERGQQLWPVSNHVEYRLALEAPGRWAAGVLRPGAGRFALGPLSEVAASTHRWDELAPHLPVTPEASFVAHERVVRGEDLSADPRVDPGVLELPLRLEEWEPDYPVAVYRPHEARFPERPATPLGTLPTVALAPVGPTVDDPEPCRALVELATAWVAESNGRVTTAAVDGDHADAVAALGDGEGGSGVGAARLARIPFDEALATMAWTGASGGAHGLRRGMATGRFGAWWAVGALSGLLDRWPPAPEDLGEAGARLRWYRWEPERPTSGWTLRLAVEHPDRGRAWSVEATDEA